MKSEWFWIFDCRVKLHKVKVSFSIRLAAFQAGGAARVVTPCEQGASDLVTSGPASGLLLENEYAGHPKQYICNTGSKFSIFHGLQNVPGFF
jgi:hypothetical protein